MILRLKDVKFSGSNYGMTLISWHSRQQNLEAKSTRYVQKGTEGISSKTSGRKGSKIQKVGCEYSE